jgi:hypothetical protein
MLNTAGSQFDYVPVVYEVLQECEHRRRAITGHFATEIKNCAREKLDQIKAAYDEVSGPVKYWKALEKEVLHVIVPQYAEAAERITVLERTDFDVWRGGDIAARALFALGGLLVGSIIIAMPFIPIVEDMFAFALAVGGFLYPDLKRWMFQRRYAKRLNQILAETARYGEHHPMRYVTEEDFERALQLPEETSRPTGSRPSS